MRTHALGLGRRSLVHLSAVLAGRDMEALREALAAAGSEASSLAVEETLLQAYLFLGYPVALNAFAIWRDLGGHEPAPGVIDEWPAWSERGEAVCRTVYGGQYDRLRENVRALHPDMERWMVVEGYGKVLGRPGLELATRELCIVALLVVLGAPRQLYSHLRGALNAGATARDIEEALDLALAVSGDARAGEARAVWEQVKERALSASESAANPNQVPEGPVSEE